jgi:plasmid maintenance system antidote protein VapI
MSNNETPLGANRVDVLLATKFLSARMYAGLDISDIAASLCVSHRDYCAMETGGRRISPEMVFRMAALTMRPIKWFYIEDRQKTKPEEQEWEIDHRSRDNRFGLTSSAPIQALLQKLRDSEI